MSDAAIVGLTVAVMGASADIFGRVLPPPYKIAGEPATRQNIDAVRRSCAQAAPVVLAIGVGASLLAKSPLPAVGAVAIMAWLWWQYETAAQHDVPTASPSAPASRRWT